MKVDLLKSLNVYKKYLVIALFTIFTILAAYLLFINLGKFPLENWDEAFYGQTTKEMLQTKDFITLHWNYNIWLEKPPMFMWLTSIIALFIGLSEFSLRLPSAICGLIIVLLATYFCYKKFSIIPAAFTFFTLILNNIFIWRARSGNIDLFVTLLIFLTFFITNIKSKYKYLILGFLFFCIYLTKASLVIFPFSIFVVSEIIYERKNLKSNFKNYVSLLMIFLGFSSIWLLLGFLKVGPEFINNFVLHGDQGGATLSGFNPNYIWHVYYSLQRRFFWLLVIGLFFLIKDFRNKTYFLLFAFSTLLLIQLSFSLKDNNWYLIPSMPFWSIIIGYAVFNIVKLFKKYIYLEAGIILILITISGYIFYKTLLINILPILNSSSTINQSQSARLIEKLSSPKDTIVRLDPLAPTTLYYNNRKTYAYAPDTSAHAYWLGPKDLEKLIINKQIKWLNGTNKDVNDFLILFNENDFTKIQVNNDEVILKVK